MIKLSVLGILLTSVIPLHAIWWKKALFLNKQEPIQFSLPLEQSNTLIVNGLSGSITIHASRQKKLEVTALKKGIEEELALVSIEKSVNEGIATLKTIEKEPSSVTIDYTLLVPERLTKIIILNQNGSVTVDNVDSSLDITVDIGDITVKNSQNSVKTKTNKGATTIVQKVFNASSSMFIEAMRGTVTITLPKTVNGTVNARTLKGLVTSSIPVTLESRTTVLTKESWQRMMRDIHGTFGKGGAPITIDVTKGNITIQGS